MEVPAGGSGALVPNQDTARCHMLRVEVVAAVAARADVPSFTPGSSVMAITPFSMLSKTAVAACTITCNTGEWEAYAVSLRQTRSCTAPRAFAASCERHQYLFNTRPKVVPSQRQLCKQAVLVFRKLGAFISVNNSPAHACTGDQASVPLTEGITPVTATMC